MENASSAGKPGQKGENWLIGIIDLLASEYGWTKDYILKRSTFVHALDFSDRIKRRKNIDNLIQLAIVQNPWSKEPKKLFDELEKGSESESDGSGDTIDHEGFKRLKDMLRKSKNIKVK